jgi:hypothetical protein
MVVLQGLGGVSKAPLEWNVAILTILRITEPGVITKCTTPGVWAVTFDDGPHKEPTPNIEE